MNVFHFLQKKFLCLQHGKILVGLNKYPSCNCVNHKTSFVAYTNEMHLTSIEKMATVACFLHCHEITPPTNRNTSPNLDLWES
jgi:hypothetical protein